MRHLYPNCVIFAQNAYPTGEKYHAVSFRTPPSFLFVCTPPITDAFVNNTLYFCTSRDSNPGLLDGNEKFTTKPLVPRPFDMGVTGNNKLYLSLHSHISFSDRRYKMAKRAPTGIEHVASPTQTENHTTRPSGRRTLYWDSNPESPAL
jgi:hypothetical protein